VRISEARGCPTGCQPCAFLVQQAVDTGRLGHQSPARLPYRRARNQEP
jgi:hypothetical protein